MCRGRDVTPRCPGASAVGGREKRGRPREGGGDDGDATGMAGTAHRRNSGAREMGGFVYFLSRRGVHQPHQGRGDGGGLRSDDKTKVDAATDGGGTQDSCRVRHES